MPPKTVRKHKKTIQGSATQLFEDRDISKIFKEEVKQAEPQQVQQQQVEPVKKKEAEPILPQANIPDANQPLPVPDNVPPFPILGSDIVYLTQKVNGEYKGVTLGIVDINNRGSFIDSGFKISLDGSTDVKPKYSSIITEIEGKMYQFRFNYDCVSNVVGLKAFFTENRIKNPAGFFTTMRDIESKHPSFLKTKWWKYIEEAYDAYEHDQNQPIQQHAQAQQMEEKEEKAEPVGAQAIQQRKQLAEQNERMSMKTPEEANRNMQPFFNKLASQIKSNACNYPLVQEDQQLMLDMIQNIENKDLLAAMIVSLLKLQPQSPNSQNIPGYHDYVRWNPMNQQNVYEPPLLKAYTLQWSIAAILGRQMRILLPKSTDLEDKYWYGTNSANAYFYKQSRYSTNVNPFIGIDFLRTKSILQPTITQNKLPPSQNIFGRPSGSTTANMSVNPASDIFDAGIYNSLRSQSSIHKEYAITDTPIIHEEITSLDLENKLNTKTNRRRKRAQMKTHRFTGKARSGAVSDGQRMSETVFQQLLDAIENGVEAPVEVLGEENVQSLGFFQQFANCTKAELLGTFVKWILNISWKGTKDLVRGRPTNERVWVIGCLMALGYTNSLPATSAGTIALLATMTRVSSESIGKIVKPLFLALTGSKYVGEGYKANADVESVNTMIDDVKKMGEYVGDVREGNIELAKKILQRQGLEGEAYNAALAKEMAQMNNDAERLNRDIVIIAGIKNYIARMNVGSYIEAGLNAIGIPVPNFLKTDISLVGLSGKGKQAKAMADIAFHK